VGKDQHDRFLNLLEVSSCQELVKREVLHEYIVFVD
jgi:hypothetical protein